MSGLREDIDPIDDLNKQGERRVFPIAADDAHCIEACCQGFVMIKAEELTYSKLFEALEKGDFYASSGPIINELYLENGILNVKTDAADSVFVSTPHMFHWNDAAKNGEIKTHWNFNINNYLDKAAEFYNVYTTDAYIRVSVRKGDKFAYTKTYFLDE